MKLHIRLFKNTFICIVFILILTVAGCSSSSKTDSKDNNEIGEQLSSEMTKDYLPGTYQSDDGDIFAISIQDDELFEHEKIRKALGGNLDTTGMIYSSIECDWLEYSASFDIGEKKIWCLSTETEDHTMELSYKLNGYTLTITDSKDNKKKYKKVSDEYKLQALISKQVLPADDIVGLYSTSQSESYLEGSNLDPYYTYDHYYIKIDKVDDTHVRVAEMGCFGEDNIDTAEVLSLAESIDTSTFIANGYAELYSFYDNDLLTIHFTHKDILSTSGTMLNLTKSTEDYNVDNKVQQVIAYLPQKYDVDLNSPDLGLANATTRDSVIFGGYEWYILKIDEKTGSYTLLTTDVVDHRQYNSDPGENTWQKCDLRQWLNGDFYDRFSDKEKSVIKLVGHYNEDIEDSDKNFEKSDASFDFVTEDYVYLLHYDSLPDQARIMRASESWWLRLTSEYSQAEYVQIEESDALLYQYDQPEDSLDAEHGVRPVITITTNNKTMTSKPEVTVKENPDNNDVSENEQSSNDSERYDNIYADTGDVIDFGGYSWTVIYPSQDVLLLLCNDTVDYTEYNVDGDDNDWGNSQICEWLNSEFYEGFTDDEKSMICDTFYYGEYYHVAIPSVDDIEGLKSLCDVETYHDIVFSSDNWWLRPAEYSEIELDYHITNYMDSGDYFDCLVDETMWVRPTIAIYRSIESRDKWAN